MISLKSDKTDNMINSSIIFRCNIPVSELLPILSDCARNVYSKETFDETLKGIHIRENMYFIESISEYTCIRNKFKFCNGWPEMIVPAGLELVLSFNKEQSIIGVEIIQNKTVKFHMTQGVITTELISGTFLDIDRMLPQNKPVEEFEICNETFDAMNSLLDKNRDSIITIENNICYFINKITNTKTKTFFPTKWPDSSFNTDILKKVLQPGKASLHLPANDKPNYRILFINESRVCMPIRFLSIENKDSFTHIITEK